MGGAEDRVPDFEWNSSLYGPGGNDKSPAYREASFGGQGRIRKRAQRVLRRSEAPRTPPYSSLYGPGGNDKSPAVREASFGGQGRIRTAVQLPEQIYSLPPLTTRPPTQCRYIKDEDPPCQPFRETIPESKVAPRFSALAVTYGARIERNVSCK